MYPNIPNIYNIPGLNLPGMNQQNKSKWSEINPFRTVEGGREYGGGLNKSAGQLYDHFHRKVALDRQGGDSNASVADYGLIPADRSQLIADFLSRRSPKPVQPPQDPGNIPGNLPGLPPNFQLPPNIFNAGQGMFPGIDFSKIQNYLNGGQPGGGMMGPAPTPTPNATGGPGPVRRPQPGPGVAPPQAPQVPQFQPSLFNMQPQMQQMMRPRPMGV